ncbi:SEC-C metal-binding domain-containing protein [Bradyrhizobium sp. USDA 4506]
MMVKISRNQPCLCGSGWQFCAAR